MSRSLESTSFTTLPPITIWPSLISSRPASMRNKVLLPQPDGPTSTTNSPSSMSNSMPWMTLVLSNDLWMLRKETAAMWGVGWSRFHGAGGEAADHVALEGVVDRRRGQRVDAAGRHEQFPRRIVGRQEVAERHRQRDAVVAGQ